MQTITNIGTLIVSTSDTCGNRPRIAGTRVTVQRIVAWHQMGMNAEAIKAEVPHLNMAQIYASLAYYYANREQIEAEIAKEAEDYERLSSQATEG